LAGLLRYVALLVIACAAIALTVHAQSLPDVRSSVIDAP
jgi:hypothetical protein